VYDVGYGKNHITYPPSPYARTVGTLNPKDLADKIFAVNKNIRYVSIVGGPRNELLEFRMRDGVKSLSGEKDDKWFAQVLAPVMLEGAEKLERDLGTITYSLVRYFKVTMVMTRIQGYFVTFSVEPAVNALDLYQEIIGQIRLF
jgi:hypothetical protein